MMDLELVLRTSALLLSASVATRVLIKATPATRHLIWHATILVVLLAPALRSVAPSINLPFVQKSEVGSVAAGMPAIGVTSPPAVQSRGFVPMLGVAGSSAVGLWFLFAWVASGWKVHRALPAPPEWVTDANTAAGKLGLRRPIEVRQSPDEGSPYVAGLFRSVVLVPASAGDWTAENRHAALVHELTHIRRGDRGTQALSQLVCAIYWFNPLTWYAAAALARERERACDAEVLRLGARPSAYASLLLDLARVTRPPWLASAALSMARPTAIEGRLLTILGSGSRAPLAASRWLVAAGAALVSALVLGAQPSVAQEQSIAPAATASRVRLNMFNLDDRAQAPQATKALTDALGDADAQVREKAAMGLAFTPGADVIEPLLGALSDPDGQVREKAAIGLAFRRDPRIVEPLITAMSDHDAQVREKAAIALGASGDPRALDALQRAVHDPDSQVREKAVAGLFLLGAPK
jgi:beta-lactamase regulating signal transducer with metallopeptidase domain